jgi:6-phosphogluconolactonase
MPTYVYVANADDGEIATYLLNPGGELEPRGRAKAAAQVAPMAVSPDQRLLYAAVRSKPFSVHVFRIDPASGALSPHSVSPLAESCPYLSLDRTGRTLFGASYGAHLVIVKDVGGDGGGRPRSAAGNPGGTQRPRHPGRPLEPLRFRALPGHRPDLPFALEGGQSPPRESR